MSVVIQEYINSSKTHYTATPFITGELTIPSFDDSPFHEESYHKVSFYYNILFHHANLFIEYRHNTDNGWKHTGLDQIYFYTFVK